MDYMSLKYNHDGGDYMNMQEVKNLFKESGFIQNPHTHKWSRGNVNTLHGELPATYVSGNTYSHSDIYVRKKVD